MNKVLKLVLVIALGLGLVVSGCVPTPAQQGVAAGEQAPDFQLQDLNGQAISLSDLRGKPVLINFWATWCPPCRGEMPYLQEIYEEWAGSGLVVLAVNLGESPAEVEDFRQSQNLTFTVLLDARQTVGQTYNITAIPTTFFIDKNGIIQEWVTGAFPDKTQIENRLSKIMP